MRLEFFFWHAPVWIHQVMVHPKMKILSPCCSKPVWLTFFCDTQKNDFLRNVRGWFLHIMGFYVHQDSFSSQHLHFFPVEDRKAHRFEQMWGWVHDDRIFMFGWNISLTILFQKRKTVNFKCAYLRVQLVLKLTDLDHKTCLILWGQIFKF